MRELRKSTFREIKSSLGRFMAIFAIIALGVGFFAGLKVTKTAMVDTVTDYLDNHAFYDYRLVSTLGFGQEDVKAFASAQDVEAAEGSVSFDVLYRLENGKQGAVKTYSVTQRLNTLKLMAGRMPQESNECVADSNFLGKSDIGSVIYLSEENEEENLENFTNGEYTIVGIVQSPLYLQFERGNTSLGTGRLDGYVYLTPEGYTVDYYTEIYVRFSQNNPLYGDGYDSFIQEKNALWEDLTDRVAYERYQDILAEAEEELADARSELEEKRAEGEAELADAAEALEEARQELADGEKALEEARQEFADGENTIREKEKELADAKAAISRSEKELNDGEAQILENEAQLTEARKVIDSNEAALRSGERQLAEGKSQLRSAEAAIEASRRTIEESRNQLNEEREKLEQDTEMDPVQKELNIARIDAALKRVGEAEEDLRAQEEALEPARQEIAESERQLEAGWQALTEAKQQLTDGQLELTAAKRDLVDGRKALTQAREEVTEGEEAIADAKEELEEARELLAEKEAEFEEGRQEFADGEKEYEDALKEFNDKIAEAEDKIEDAEGELAELEEPDTYVLGRDTNVGYVCFESDSNIVEGIANIFPVFFFLVAALVCITTMNRMVEEQRTQIGVLKALGYGDGAIMSKYMIYSGTAAVTGCVFGFLLGTWGFPKIIWFCYNIMYSADPISYVFDWGLAVISLMVSLLCSIGTTWLSCRVELNQVAAALMRPKAPKAGRRVFLEWIPFIWKRLNFLGKVSMRNIFRYKKRLFMMVVGISGCTALLVTGFGIKDSIADVAAKQFQEIQTYDIGISLNEEADEEWDKALEELKDKGAAEYICVMEKNMDLLTEDGVKSVYLVAGTREGMEPFLNLHTTQKTPVDYPSAGEAVISNKLAEDYDIGIGDTITLRDEEMRSVTVAVSAVYENYIYNYVHVSEETWRELTGEEPERKTVYLNLPEEIRADADALDLAAHELAAELMGLKQVLNVTVNADTMDRIGTMMSSLNIIVVVVILCAAGLAFIVLYNLTNINITERLREIATIKVLGFYRKETEAYVFRENIMLTVLGMAVGLVLGHFLHLFVMNEIRVDLISFHIYVKPVSYLYSALLTLVFAWCVNKTMGGKLESISMTESLKSVD